MTERYAFRYTEFLMGQAEQDWLFDSMTAETPLMADVRARVMGLKPENGFSPWAKLGVRVSGDWPQAESILELTDDYGKDACRIALLEARKPSHSDLTAAWREVGQLWHFLKDKTEPVDFNNPIFYPFLKALQAQDFKKAWIELKTIEKKEPQGNLNCLFYPFVPHLVRSLDNDIHSKMAEFWENVLQISISVAYFIEINGRFVMDFYPQNSGDEEKIKNEALSFSVIQNKIKEKSVQKIIFIQEKGINIVV